MNLTQLMAEKQDNLNELTIKGWLHKGLNYPRALTQEAAEAMDSLPWKWWKDGKIDKENLKVEAVDMVHFALSILIQEGYKTWDWIDGMSRDIMKAEVPYVDDNLTEKLEDTLDEIILLTYTTTKLKTEPPHELYFKVLSFANILGMSYEDVFKAYFAKNILNEFRQANGYKDGTYLKTWLGQEDNVHAMEIAKQLSIGERFNDNLYAALEKRYKEISKDKKGQ